MSEFWDELIEAANNCGLRSSYIAAAANLNPSTVGKYKKGSFKKNFARLERFVEVVGYRIVLEKIPEREDIYRKDRMFHLPPLPPEVE